jgi:hypothetical protein
VLASARFSARDEFDAVSLGGATGDEGGEALAPGPLAKVAGSAPLRRLRAAPRRAEHTAEVVAEQRPPASAAAPGAVAGGRVRWPECPPAAAPLPAGGGCP